MRLQKIEKAINNLSNEKFNELLNELGVKVDKWWVPRYVEDYYYVSESGDASKTFWNNDTCDNHRLLMNNVFKTEDEARIQRDFNIKKAKLIKEIEDNSDVMNWEDDNQIKYSLYYDHYGEEIEITSCRQHEIQGVTHTTNKEFLENLIKNEPERIKKYLFEVK